MPYAKFERAEPREWREIPFSYDDAESLPSLPEIIGWILLGGMFISLMFLTFCME